MTMAAELLHTESFRQVVEEVYRASKGGMITLLPIDQGGFAIYAHMKPWLNEYGIPYVHYPLVKDKSMPRKDHTPEAEGRDDYRRIIAISKRDGKGYRTFPLNRMRSAVKKQTDLAFVLEHDIHHGHGITGGLKHGMDFYDVYGIAEGGLHGIAEVDGLGYVAHLALKRYYDEPVELDALLRLRLPESYEKYANSGRLKLLADTPEIHMLNHHEVQPIRRRTGMDGTESFPLLR